MRMAEKMMHINPDANSVPTPIFWQRGMWRGMTSLSGKNMTMCRLELLHLLRVEGLTQEIR
jgi:hypothetical protein